MSLLYHQNGYNLNSFEEYKNTRMNFNLKFPGILFIILFVLLFSCRKDSINTGSSNVPVVTNVPVNRSPTAFAGSDLTIQQPINYIIINGSYQTPNGFSRVEWKKLTGAPCFIENQNERVTKVTGAQPGIYEFEFTVYDMLNLSAKDTLTVTVLPVITSPLTTTYIFNNLTWIFPWYNAVEVTNFNFYLQLGKPFKIFIQRAASPAWIEAKPVDLTGTTISGPYEYFIERRPDGAGMYNYGSLYVFYYGNDVSDKPNVKVEY
jgi:hypothetical protein